MIDLSAKLPDSLTVGECQYKVLTDFRAWLRIADIVDGEHALIETSFIFEDDPPLQDWTVQMMEFLACPEVTPHGAGGEQLFDWLKDGSYILGSFQQAYGIDLLEAHMHWHRFLALFRSLPDDSKIMKIVGHRGWKKSNKKHDSVQGELRRMWTLPNDIDQDAIERGVFGG